MADVRTRLRLLDPVRVVGTIYRGYVTAIHEVEDDVEVLVTWTNDTSGGDGKPWSAYLLSRLVEVEDGWECAPGSHRVARG